jgi:hypothetical protein
MKKILVLIVSLAPILAVAANVFIWNYDPVDKFYEPAINDSVDCAYWVEQTLDAAGHTFVTGMLLPTDLSGYDAVFALLGWYRC